MKASLQKHQKPAPSAPASTLVAQEPAAQTASSNELVRLHLLRMAAEAQQEAQQAQPVAQRQPIMPTKPVTRWTPPKPSGKTVADELARISKKESECN